MSETKPLWIPTNDRIQKSNFKKYERFLKEEFKLEFSDYSTLHNWSTTDIETFWESIWKFSGLIHSKPFEKILDKSIMPGAKWFQGSQLNFAENLLKFKDDNIAIISSREDKPDIALTYKELNEHGS